MASRINGSAFARRVETLADAVDAARVGITRLAFQRRDALLAQRDERNIFGERRVQQIGERRRRGGGGRARSRRGGGGSGARGGGRLGNGLAAHLVAGDAESRLTGADGILVDGSERRQLAEGVRSGPGAVLVLVAALAERRQTPSRLLVHDVPHWTAALAVDARDDVLAASVLVTE